MLPGHKFGFVQRKPVISSSAVKKCHTNKIDQDTTMLINDGKQNAEEDQSKKRKANNELYSQLYTSPKKTLLSKRIRDENNNNPHSFDTIDSKSCIVFRNWYPFLLSGGRLHIEGCVKGEITSRSFPIAKRLTSNKLQCIYKRICILEGPLNEGRIFITGPDYILKRFRYGFPEDWEVVAYFWTLNTNFTHFRNLSSFKWPEPNPITSDEKNIDNNKSRSSNVKSYQVFSRWRILINNEGELIIEGISRCGNIKKSKPIIKRFSNRKVCSFKDVYVLEGTLANERNELPDYVRWKFHNGFPVDWEDVCQHWENYLAKRATDEMLL